MSQPAFAKHPLAEMAHRRFPQPDQLEARNQADWNHRLLDLLGRQFIGSGSSEETHVFTFSV
jgi:hypothetical protein